MLKVGMFTSGYQRNPLEHCFMDAKEYGYDYIELCGGRPHAYAPDLKAGDINEVRRLIEKYEMPVLGYTPEHNAYPYNYMIGSEAQRRDAIDYLKLSLEMAKEMGARQVANIIMAGAFTAKTGIFTQEELSKSVKHMLGKKPEFIELNEAAVQKGISLVQNTSV